MTAEELVRAAYKRGDGALRCAGAFHVFGPGAL